MKKYFAITALAFALFLGTGSTVWAQAAVLGFDDHNGSPNSGTYSPGASFTFTLNLHFIPGGTVLNVAGISYWLQQVGAASGGPFYFSIGNRDATGSQFTFLQSPGNIFPQPMNSANAPFGSNVKDLGASTASGSGLAGGDYFIANITINIDPTIPQGVYQIGNTTVGGKTSVIFDDAGHSANIPQSLYTITIVPEPSSLALCASGLPFAVGLLRRLRARKS